MRRSLAEALGLSAERTVLFVISVLLFCSSWFWAGADIRALPFIRCGGVLATLLLLLLRGLNAPEAKDLWLKTRTDPLFIPALLLLSYLSCQWLNAWWPENLNALSPTEYWIEGKQYIPWLPSTVFAQDGELVFWKGAYALLIALLLRNGIQSNSGIRKLYQFILINGVGLVIFGLLFELMENEYYYGVIPVDRPFFGSFFYNNHAGEYFYLSLACALTLLLHQIKRKRRKLPIPQLLIITCCLVLYIIAVFCIVSRVAIAVSLLLIGLGTFLFIKRILKYYPATTKLYIGTALLGVVVLAAILIQTAFSDPLHRKLAQSQKLGHSARGEIISTRAWQWETAVNLWDQRKLYGAGSGTYPYFCIFYTPTAYQNQLDRPYAGQVHNDFLQFLCQQGLIGLGLLVGVAIPLLNGIKNKTLWTNESCTITALACVLLLVHSMIDLPFSSMGVTSLWMALLTGSLKTAQLRILKNNRVHD